MQTSEIVQMTIMFFVKLERGRPDAVGYNFLFEPAYNSLSKKK